jgi:RNA polymerase sigma-70 factor (ECF subfamily)
MQDGSVITVGTRAWPEGIAKKEAAAAREERFAGLVERQSRFVFRVAYAIVRNSQDAEDVVQETFLKLYRTGAWEGIRDERAFLARVAWRMAVERLPRGRMRCEPEQGSREPMAPGASPEEAAIAADWNAAVRRMVDALPEELRQPLALSTVEDLSSREIGEVMGIPEGTVRTRLMRARQILKEKVARATEGRYGK